METESLFSSGPASQEAEKTPSVVGHEKSSQLPTVAPSQKRRRLNSLEVEPLPPQPEKDKVKEALREVFNEPDLVEAFAVKLDLA